MKYREKIVQIEFLDDEERVIRRLQAVYNQSLKDITQKANALQEEIYKIQDKYNSIEDEQERETLKSMERSKVYQKQYQDALKAQVNSILDKMHRKEFKTVNKYLNDCYDKAFTGNMYVLHGEGIPLIVPIDQEKVVRAARYLGMMFGAGAHGVADRESLYLLTTNLVLWIILIIGSTPLTDVRYQHMLRRKKWNTTLLNGIVYAVLFILCIAYLVTETYNPFLYFRF